MKFKTLIDKYEWPEVQPILLELYPNQNENIDGYKDVYETLLNLTPTQTNMQIVIENVIDDTENYVNVSSKIEIENEKFNYGLDFVEWAEWLDMTIHAPNFSELEIIAHCLYEMTFYGFNQEEIENTYNEILNTKEEYHINND